MGEPINFCPLCFSFSKTEIKLSKFIQQFANFFLQVLLKLLWLVTPNKHTFAWMFLHLIFANIQTFVHTFNPLHPPLTRSWVVKTERGNPFGEHLTAGTDILG